MSVVEAISLNCRNMKVEFDMPQIFNVKSALSKIFCHFGGAHYIGTGAFLSWFSHVWIAQHKTFYVCKDEASAGPMWYLVNWVISNQLSASLTHCQLFSWPDKLTTVGSQCCPVRHNESSSLTPMVRSQLPVLHGGQLTPDATADTAAPRMGEERIRGEETLSGETHNVQNNKALGGFPQSLDRPVRREVPRAAQGPSGTKSRGHLRLSPWGKNPRGEFLIYKCRVMSHQVFPKYVSRSLFYDNMSQSWGRMPWLIRTFLPTLTVASILFFFFNFQLWHPFYDNKH